MTEINVCYSILDLGNCNISATQLRGYLGHLFADTPEFHHHMEKPFHYPLIQYKKYYDGKYMIMGFDSYSDILFDKINDVEYVISKNQKFPVLSCKLSRKTISVQNSNPISYKFNSPWIALNEKNYSKYNSIKNKREFLQNILVGNILSACAGLGMHVDFPIMTDIKRFEQKNITVHKNNFTGIKCYFRANISLVPFMGLGKSVSKGFGVITNIDS